MGVGVGEERQVPYAVEQQMQSTTEAPALSDVRGYSMTMVCASTISTRMSLLAPVEEKESDLLRRMHFVVQNYPLLLVPYILDSLALQE